MLSMLSMVSILIVKLDQTLVELEMNMKFYTIITYIKRKKAICDGFARFFSSIYDEPDSDRLEYKYQCIV